MAIEASWGSVIHGINFKEQNYVNSCFAASYQNLMANIPSSHRGLCTGRYCNIELLEYNYMIRKGYDLENASPSKNLVNAFVVEYLDPLRYSCNAIRNSITADELVSFGQTPSYNVGYLLWTGDSPALHSQALFIRKIRNVDYYILLNSAYPCIAEDAVDFMQPCSNGLNALYDLRISNSINGGVLSVF